MSKHLRSNIGKALSATALVIALAAVAIGLSWWSGSIDAATPITGAISAKASGTVTIKTFVKLSSAGVIIASTARTDKVVGVCEQTAADTKLTKYAPVGSAAIVTAAETVAVGDLVTSGASGYAYVLRPNGVMPQRVAGIATTAATVGTDLGIIVTASAVGTDETMTATDTTPAANESGFVYLVTATATITLPAVAPGATFTFINGGALDATVGVTISPNASDKITGLGATGTNNKDIVNTVGTAKRGDMLILVGGAANVWNVVRCIGTWDREG